jgi:hypothetical protein
MKTAIVNLNKIITGDWRNPLASGDSIPDVRWKNRGSWKC